VVAVPGKTKDRDRVSSASAPAMVYEPSRPARLRAPAEPPPMPQSSIIHSDGFGTADEDGLRMLAALESLTSLEPDYSVDLIAEASVTIIEAADNEILADAFDELPRRQHPRSPAYDAPSLNLPNGYDPFDGPSAFLDEEAIVEIIEAPPAFDEVDPPGSRQVPQPASLSERIASVAGRSAGGRFFKALSGG